MPTLTIDDLEQAMSQGEFTFYYQPKVDLRNGSISGAEALIRWIRPDGSIVPPRDFIPLAEATEFITNITAILVGDIVTHIQPLISRHPALKVAFNVSTADLATPYLAKILSGYVSEGRIAPDHIEIEMTESTVVAHAERVGRSIRELRELGFSVALDDFGTGYSAFNVLCDHPFTTLKIDRRLVDSVEVCPRYRAAVESVVHLARRLEMCTVAEGIETEAQLAAVRAIGCCQAQGFLLGKPMPRTRFQDYLRTSAGTSGPAFGSIPAAMLRDNSAVRNMPSNAESYLR